MPEQLPATQPHFLRRIPRGCRIAGCLILAVPCTLVGLFLLFISLLSPPASPANAAPLPPDFHKGITFESWWKEEFSGSNADQVLADIIQPMGADWIALIVKCQQATLASTDINCAADTTATDSELAHVIQQAHSLGIKVMLKPHIDLTNPGDGRHNINFGSDESAWDKWFASYSAMMTSYAALAQENGVEYMVVGTELWGTSSRADDWRTLIRAVREVYDGPLTYAALTYFEPWQISWWDALDSIGIDAYYLLTLSNQPTLEQMKLGLQPAVFLLDQLAARWQMPVIFTEVGYMSVDGSNRLPGHWQLDGPTDPQEQADSYQAIFEVFNGKSWWKGVYWWSLDTNPNQGGLADRSYSPHGKPAEDILRQYFRPNAP
jgi:hypothetical protein